MIGKLIAHAGTRGEALERMHKGLRSTVVLGLTTNLGLLQQIISDPNIARGLMHTSYLDENLARYSATNDAAAAVACACSAAIETECAALPRWPWSVCHPVGVLDRVGLVPGAPLGVLSFWIGRDLYTGTIAAWSDGAGTIAVGGEEFSVRVDSDDGGLQRGRIGEKFWYAARARIGMELSVGGTRFTLEPYGDRNPAQFSIGASALSPMPGIVVALPAAIGQAVRAGDVLAVVEAMKMENKVTAAFDGTVKAINCSLTQSVNAGDLLVTVEPAE